MHGIQAAPTENEFLLDTEAECKLVMEDNFSIGTCSSKSLTERWSSIMFSPYITLLKGLVGLALVDPKI